jgi:hypothetical protein
VPVSSTPTTGSAHELSSTRSQPHAMHSSAPIDTRRTRAAPAAIGLDQPSVSWHHVRHPATNEFRTFQEITVAC